MVLISAAISTVTIKPTIPGGIRLLTMVIYASVSSDNEGNKTRQIIPGRIKRGTSRIFNQPVKFAPNCPCFRLFAPSTDCTILWSVHQNQTPITGYPNKMAYQGYSMLSDGRKSFQ